MSFRTKIIKIDSSKVNRYFNPYHTNFSFLVDPAISITQKDVIVYSLLNVWIPYSFYAVNQYNQNIDISICNDSVVTNTSYAIPQGNYNTYDFAKLLNSLLGNQFVFTYNKFNNTFSISFSSTTKNPKDSATFLFATGLNAITSCKKLLGCLQVDQQISTGTYMNTGMVLMNDIAYFQIKSDIGNADNIITGDENESLLEIIPVSSEPLSYISYAPFQPNKFLLHNNNLTEIKIALLDNYGRDVNLNGIPFLLTLKIDIISSEEAGLTRITSRSEMDKLNEDQDDEQTLTNLEILHRHPGIINIPINTPPIDVTDFLEYRLILDELKKIKKKK